MARNTYGSEFAMQQAKRAKREQFRKLVERRWNITWAPFEVPTPRVWVNPKPDLDCYNDYCGFRFLPREEKERYLAEFKAHYEEGKVRFKRDIKWMERVLREEPNAVSPEREAEVIKSYTGEPDVVPAPHPLSSMSELVAKRDSLGLAPRDAEDRKAWDSLTPLDYQRHFHKKYIEKPLDVAACFAAFGKKLGDKDKPGN